MREGIRNYCALQKKKPLYANIRGVANSVEYLADKLKGN